MPNVGLLSHSRWTILKQCMVPNGFGTPLNLISHTWDLFITMSKMSLMNPSLQASLCIFHTEAHWHWTNTRQTWMPHIVFMLGSKQQKARTNELLALLSLRHLFQARICIQDRLWRRRNHRTTVVPLMRMIYNTSFIKISLWYYMEWCVNLSESNHQIKIPWAIPIAINYSIKWQFDCFTHLDAGWQYQTTSSDWKRRSIT